MTNNRNAIVTGATSGLGFEAAAQLAERGYAKVTITGRTTARAEEARRALVAETGKDVFATLVLDLDSSASIESAAAEIVNRHDRVDTLLLNAGIVPGTQMTETVDGVEVTFASSLIGHHQLTMALLENHVLSPNARIVIAGSEAARGDIPTFKPVDLYDLAAKHRGGDLVAAAKSIIRHDKPVKFAPGNTYANTKLFVAWWAAALARRLPAGMTVNAVSPGSVPSTNADRNANFFMKRIMAPVLRHAPKRLGLAASVEVGAKRYIDATEFGPEVTGDFFASAPKKMTGPLHRVELPHVHDQASQEAAWEAVVHISGGAKYPLAA
jgi:NAD(P)-dependent dehydrogenase (short-subunit alcohol dehydrogenase family)